MTNEVLGNFKIWDEDFTYVDNRSFNYYTNGLKAIAWNGTAYIANFNAFLTIFEDDRVYILDNDLQYNGENYSIGFDDPVSIEWDSAKSQYFLTEQFASGYARVRVFNTTWDNIKNYTIAAVEIGNDYNDLTYYNSNWYALESATFGGFEIQKYSYGDFPTSPSLEVGIVDGIKEWEYNGTFEQENNRTNNFSSVFVNYLDACTADSDGYCLVPFYVTSNAGLINITDMQIKYVFDQNPLILNLDAINSFFENSDGEADLPIRFQALSNGTLTISDIRYDYAGGNDTISVLVFNATDGEDRTVNETLNLTIYSSNWNYAFPSYISWLEFIPGLPTAKNVTPFGQTSSKPMLNITNYGYGGMESNFSVSLNETHSCVNLTMSTTNEKSSGFMLNATWRDYFSDFSYLDSQGLWMLAVYSCNYST